LAARRDYGERVVLLAGNRDINKLRLVRELTGAPPPGAPASGTRGALLRSIFANTMGAPDAFAHRGAELGACAAAAVVDRGVQRTAGSCRATSTIWLLVVRCAPTSVSAASGFVPARPCSCTAA